MKKGADHTKEVTSLKKIEGQIRGITKMVEDERYCIDILNQFKAVFSALEKVELRVLEGHLYNCVLDAFDGNEKQTKLLLAELASIIKKTGRKI